GCDGGLAASTASAPVIGGSAVAPGKWPDVAAILFPVDGEVALCTGTLIAPTVVLTAGHCYNRGTPPLPDSVLIGASSLSHPEQGETIPIAHGYVYPDAPFTEDLAVLVLSRPSTHPPRQIVDGWARADLVNGAMISLVGFGALDRAGTVYVDALQEATTTITDVDCSTSSGCNPGAQPAGELGAGGMGVDTCPGDSGGPLYLTTSYGAVLAGVTARSYDDARFPCSEGGVYTRPDKALDWIEKMAGVPVARVSAPTAPMVAMHDSCGGTQISVNDPASQSHRFRIKTQPAHGGANVAQDGTVWACNDPGAPDDDHLVVTITDMDNTQRSVDVAIPVGTAGGCCDAGGGPGGALPLALGVFALVRRRAARNPRG
ncbi:MAG TPA: trypsin-like serine protease, partial [Kofleriaceae bacterium]|nr:trypsin-like serine protease [Kofleriaceae bacterium]